MKKFWCSFRTLNPPHPGKLASFGVLLSDMQCLFHPLTVSPVNAALFILPTLMWRFWVLVFSTPKGDSSVLKNFSFHRSLICTGRTAFIFIFFICYVTFIVSVPSELTHSSFHTFKPTEHVGAHQCTTAIVFHLIGPYGAFQSYCDCTNVFTSDSKLRDPLRASSFCGNCLGKSVFICQQDSAPMQKARFRDEDA